MLKRAQAVLYVRIDFSLQVNDLYRGQFEQWASVFPEWVELVSDGTSCNEDRLGAVACIQLAVKHFDIQDDLTVIGGCV